MGDHDELPLDDRDLLGVLGLPRHLPQRPAAGRAHAIRLVELVHDIDARQPRLGPGAMAALGRRGRGY
jgi:hypothetical protein